MARTVRPRVCSVYAIACDGQPYVGSSRHTRKRWQTHRSRLNLGIHENGALQAAWRARGSQNFVFTVLEDVADPSALIEREQWWIDHLNSVAGGFNLVPQAGSNRGMKHSPEARAAISAALRERVFTDPMRAKRRAAAMGNAHRAKLTLPMVAEIEARLAAGASRRAVARECGLAASTINRLANGTGWRPQR